MLLRCSQSVLRRLAGVGLKMGRELPRPIQLVEQALRSGQVRLRERLPRDDFAYSSLVHVKLSRYAALEPARIFEANELPGHQERDTLTRFPHLGVFVVLFHRTPFQKDADADLTGCPVTDDKTYSHDDPACTGGYCLRLVPHGPAFFIWRGIPSCALVTYCSFPRIFSEGYGQSLSCTLPVPGKLPAGRRGHRISSQTHRQIAIALAAMIFQPSGVVRILVQVLRADKVVLAANHPAKA